MGERTTAVACAFVLVLVVAGVGGSVTGRPAATGPADHRPPAPSQAGDPGGVAATPDGNDTTLRDPAWQRRYEAGGSVTLRAATPAGDGYLLAGSVRGGGNQSALVFRVNDTGGVVWWRTLGGAGHDRVLGVARAGDGGVLLAGTADAPNPYVEGDRWLAKVTAGGEVAWTKAPGPGRYYDAAPAVDGPGALAVGGSNDGGARATLVAPDGSVRFDRTYDGSELTGVRAAGEGYLVSGTALDGGVLGGWGLDLSPDGRVRERVTVGPDGFARFDAVAATDRGAVFVGRPGGWAVGTGGDFAVEWDRETGGDELQAALGRGDRVLVGGDDGVALLDRTGATLDRRSFGPTVRALVAVEGGYLVLGGPRAELVDVDPPEAAIELRGESPAEAGNVTLSAAASSDDRRVAAYRWDLDGDGAVDRTTTTPRLRVSARGGNRSVAVVVADGSNNTDRATTSFEVVDTRPPSVGLARPDPRVVVAGRSVELASNATDGGRIAAYHWDFGADGAVDRTTYDPTVSRAFAAGNRTVELTVVDRAGNRASERFRIRAGRNRPPRLNVSVTETAAGVRQFRADVADRTGNVTVTWSFPHGVERTGRNASYVFGADGNYTVEVTATDEYGATAERTLTVSVGDGESPDARPDGGESTPGFGVGAALLAAGLGALVRRYRS